MAQAETTNITSRGSFLAVATAAAIVPAAALGQQTDPIFAAIDRHRVAFAEFVRMSIATDTVAARNQDRDVTQQAKDDCEAACDAQQEACAQLIETIPLTAAGVGAAIRWLAEYDTGCVPEASAEFMLTLLKSPVLR